MSTASVRSVATVGLIWAAFLFGALGTAVAQGRGNGGGGDTSASTSTPTGWIEQFSDSIAGIESRGWGIEQTGSPDSLFGVPGTGLASKSYDSANVAITNGILSLRLDISQTLNSSGALVYTKQKYGFGTYEWCMRMSSTATAPTGSGVPVSGSISAGFSYVNNSQTEIDFEQARVKDSAGALNWWLYMANWANRRLWHSAVLANSLPPNPTYAEFKAYKFVWTKNYIDFYVNGSLLATHTTYVPTASAYVLMNHWGTNNPDGFGGPVEPGTRYFYVDWVRYTPPGGSPVSPTTACPAS